MVFFVYILECRDKTLYTGCTKDLENRIDQHSAGKGSRYVRTRLPFRLVYTETFKTQSQALKRENQIKGLSRKEKHELIGRIYKEYNTSPLSGRS
jgi:putative endonuclease